MKSGILSVIALVVVGGGVATYFLNRNKVDTKDADKKLKENAEAAAGPVTSVDCPEASRKKGVKFDCKVVFVGGQTNTMNIEFINDDGGYRWKFAKPIVGAEKLATMVSTAIKQQKNVDAKVECGKGIVDLPPDGLPCTITAGAETAHVLAKLDTMTGDVTWSAAPQ